MTFYTDVLIWVSRGNEGAARLINNCAARALSVVSFMELLQGARSKLEINRIQQLLLELEFTTLPLSESIGATAAALIGQHALVHGIRVSDALIAATAIVLGQQLCTANVKHFRPLRGLSLAAFRP